MKEKVCKKKKNNASVKAVIIVSAVAVFIIAVILTIIFVLPIFSAQRELKDRISGFDSISDGDIILLSDPYNSDVSTLPTTVDVIFEGDKAKNIAEELCSFLRRSKYSGKESNIHGFWDISFTLRSDSVYLVYICEDVIYVTKDTERYNFTPEDTDGYSLFYKKVCKYISEQALKR